jgi:hypothetical protein
LQVFLLQVDVSEIVVDEGDEPNAVIDLLYPEALSGEDGGAGCSCLVGGLPPSRE